MDQARQERIARNEAAYRELNEAIEAGSTPARRFDLLCECGHVRCTKPLRVTAEQYEAVRANPRRFLVLPRHEMEEAEHVVEDHGAYRVVEKPEDVAHIVEGRDPRA